MSGSFDFMMDRFPEFAEDGRKAERYLYIDKEVCMFFISRIFDNAVKYICSFNDVKNDSTKLAENVSELFKKGAIDESIYLLLEMMRTFRNGNAHNKDYSLNESIILLQVSHIICEWLMETYGASGYQRKGFTMPSRESMSKPSDSKPPKQATLHTMSKPSDSKPPAMSDDDFLKLCGTASLKKVKAAINNGANVNAANAKGRTALMMAAMSNTHPEVLELLMDSGADIKAKSKRGTTALVYAEANTHLRSTKALERLQSSTKKGNKSSRKA